MPRRFSSTVQRQETDEKKNKVVFYAKLPGGASLPPIFFVLDIFLKLEAFPQWDQPARRLLSRGIKCW